MDHSDFDAGAILQRIREKAETRTDDERSAYERQRLEADRRERIEVLRAWQVSRRVLRALKQPQETGPIKAVRAWAESESWCLVLSSRPGVGKSVAAGLWLLEQSEGIKPNGNLTRRWVSGSQLARVDGFGGELDQLGKSGPLVIDDLGVEYADRNGALQSRLDGLLDERYANFRKTLITTNLTAAEFRDRYGERIVDRIREAGANAFVEFRGESLRGVA